MAATEYNFLKSLPMLTKINDATLRQLAAAMVKRRYRTGNFIFSQGEKVDSLYFIEMGKVEIFKSDANGRKLTLWFIEEGDVFCLANMYAEHSFANACCVQDTLLFCLPKTALEKILVTNNELSMQFIHCISSKLAVYSELIDDFAFLKMLARVAKVILTCKQQDDQQREVCTLSQGDIASMVGTCREVVSRTIKKLKEEGSVTTENSGTQNIIVITDSAKLQETSLTS